MKKFLLIFTAVTLFASLVSPVLAQNRRQLTGIEGRNCLYNPGGDIRETGVVTIDCILPLFANIIFWLLMLSGTVALFFIVFGGFKLLTSGGDPKNVEGARKTITWAIIGLVVVLLSFGIVSFIGETTGVACIREFGFSQCGGGGGGRSGVCGGSNPGTCPNPAQSCVFEAGGGGRYICVVECEGDHPGWCSPGSTCRQVAINPGVTTWRCESN